MQIERKEKRNLQFASMQLEERLNVERKRGHKHKAVISEIPKDANADLDKMDPRSSPNLKLIPLH